MQKRSDRSAPFAAGNNTREPAVADMPESRRNTNNAAGSPAFEEVKPFGPRLATNAKWMKDFLHVDKPVKPPSRTTGKKP